MLIAGPNLTIDRTLTIDELRPGEVLRFTSAEITPGGKGVNVARVARVLGAPFGLVGFVPGRTGEAVVRMLADEGIAVRAVPVAGEVRSAAIVLERGGRTTVLNEPGPGIDEADWRAYEHAVEESLAGHGVLVCSGSVPPGAPRDAYARLVELARRRGAAALVDATGEQLEAALAARPDVVTPNVGEAEGVLYGRAGEAVDVPLADARERALAAAAALANRGVGLAVVTAGAAGVAAVARGEARWLPAPRVAVRNPIGAGDSFAGGLVDALERGQETWNAVAAGAATAAASVESPLAGGIDPARVRELLAELAPQWKEAAGAAH